MARRTFYRILFIFAGCYNLAWGFYSSLYPQWLFEFFGMPPLNHPEIFRCLAMVVGVYGLLYLEVARVPEKGWAIAAVGLLGKILGPMGAIYLIAMGNWPTKGFAIIFTNDLIWWIPFSFYLYDSRRCLTHYPLQDGITRVPGM
jgi:hypothetical protein